MLLEGFMSPQGEMYCRMHATGYRVRMDGYWLPGSGYRSKWFN